MNGFDRAWARIPGHAGVRGTSSVRVLRGVTRRGTWQYCHFPVSVHVRCAATAYVARDSGSAERGCCTVLCIRTSRRRELRREGRHVVSKVHFLDTSFAFIESLRAVTFVEKIRDFVLQRLVMRQWRTSLPNRQVRHPSILSSQGRQSSVRSPLVPERYLMLQAIKAAYRILTAVKVSVRLSRLQNVFRISFFRLVCRRTLTVVSSRQVQVLSRS